MFKKSAGEYALEGVERGRRGQERAKKLDASATEIAASISDLLDKTQAENPNALWDHTVNLAGQATNEGKRQYMATLLHEVATKLGLTYEEVARARVEQLGR